MTREIKVRGVRESHIPKLNEQTGREVSYREIDLTDRIKDPKAKELYVRRRGYAEGRDGCENLSNEELEYLVRVLEYERNFEDEKGGKSDTKIEPPRKKKVGEHDNKGEDVGIAPPRGSRILQSTSGKWILPIVKEDKNEE